MSQNQSRQIPKEVQDLIELKGTIIDSAVGRSNGVINDAINIYLQRAAAIMMELVEKSNTLQAKVTALEAQRKAAENPKKVPNDDAITPPRKK